MVRSSSGRGSGTSSSTASSSSSSSSESTQPIRRKKTTTAANKKSPTKNVSPSVSHPKNKSTLRKKKVKSAVKRSASAESALGDKVLPLLLENVVNHTETKKHAVNKENTVQAFLQTIGAVNGKYSVVEVPDIVPIPSPTPHNKVISNKNKKKKKGQEKPEKKSEKEVTSHPEYESDDDTGMYTETISKYGLETKLLKKRIQSTDGSKNGDIKESYPPLNSSDLQKKFQALVNIGAKQFKEGNSKVNKEAFSKWCKENGETNVVESQPVASSPWQQNHEPQVKHDKRRNSPNEEAQNAAPKLTSDLEKPQQSQQEHEVSARPKKVSKSTSAAQTEEHAAEKDKRIDIPDVLMLDSYTQTNEADRLSTKLITCNKKATSNTQTEPLKQVQESVSPDPLLERIKSSTRSLVPYSSKTVTSPPKPSERTLTKKVSFSIQTKDDDSGDSDSDARVESNFPVSFEIKNTCRHGNERSRCDQCNDSVVRKKYGNTFKEKSIFAREHDSESGDKTTSRLPLPVSKTKLDNENSSMKDAEVQPAPQISDAKLAKIKHLAKAKLKQIKKPDENRLRRSLEKFEKLDAVEEENANYTAISPTKQKRRKKVKTHDGIESFTLHDLPQLVEPYLPNESDNSSDESDNQQKYQTKRTLRKVSKHEERKHQSDVEKAKKFIQHCIDTPVVDERKPSSSYRHKSRSQRRDSGVRSLPILKDSRRCESEATNKGRRGIADDVESRQCVSEVPSGKLHRFDVNYKAYVHALQRIVNSNLSSLTQAERYSKNK